MPNVTHPLSVVIPCYDEGELLTEAVHSVYQQDPRTTSSNSYEVLLVPDHGIDETTETVVSNLADTYASLRIVPNRRTSGPSGARNTGIEAARGEWIAFLDGDDLWFSNAIRVRRQVAAEWPDSEWIATDFVRSTPSTSGEPVRYTRSSPTARRIVKEALESREEIRLEKPVAEFSQVVLCCTDTVTARKSLLERVGGFSEKLQRCEDIHLWFRLASVTDLVYSPKVTAHYRLRESSVENRGYSTPWGWDIRAAKDLLRDPSLALWRKHIAKGRLRWVLNRQTQFYRRQERYLAGLRTTMQSIRYHPWQKRAWKDLLACLIRRS